MPKKPFTLRSVQCTHIKYAKKMKKIDREVLIRQNRENPFFLWETRCEYYLLSYSLWLIPTQDHTGFTQDSTRFKNLVDFLEIYTGFHKIPQDPGNPVGPKWPNINVSRTRRKSPFPQDIRKIPQDSTRFTKIPQDRNICERWLERWPYIFDETFFLQAEKLFSKQKLKYLNKVYFYLYTLCRRYSIEKF